MILIIHSSAIFDNILQKDVSSKRKAAFPIRKDCLKNILVGSEVIEVTLDQDDGGTLITSHREPIRSVSCLGVVP